MSKKPWIWPACRSSVSTRSAPARGDQVGDQLGRDRRAGPGFAVLPGVAEIGDHRGDAPRRGAAQRVDDDQQLHQVVVGRKGRRLDDEDVLAADVLLDLDEDLHVGEAPHHRLRQRGGEIGGDRLGELGVGVAGDELDRSVLRRHGCLLRRPAPTGRSVHVQVQARRWQYGRFPCPEGFCSDEATACAIPAAAWPRRWSR